MQTTLSEKNHESSVSPDLAEGSTLWSQCVPEGHTVQMRLFPLHSSLRQTHGLKEYVISNMKN